MTPCWPPTFARRSDRLTDAIVGVVINAVDDNLLKGEQIDTRWSRDEIKVLPALLHEARMARRLVVLLSDHGHVLDCQTQAAAWRRRRALADRRPVSRPPTNCWSRASGSSSKGTG